jgi:hypothetical protein
MKKNKNRGYQKLRVLNDLAYKRESGDWVDNLMTKESNAAYTTN